MYFKREELKKFRSFRGPLIDVRSPSEYYKGHMPNSINIPLFDDEERALVGTTYKKNGRDKAIREGLKIVEQKIDKLLKIIFESINSQNLEFIKEKNYQPLIRLYCARGGMRSTSLSWLLEKYKFNTVLLDGGYKKYRNWTLNSFSKTWNIIVLGGKTGTGKTKILKLLEKNNYQTIDLEDFAQHRGSTFGGLGMGRQPTNETFENKIAEKLNTFNRSDPVFVEAESANIGKCKVPHEFFKQMHSSRRIEIIRSESNRINELIDTYSVFKKEDLIEAILRIKKRLGPERTKTALLSINKKEWHLVCKAVLQYYDKCYEYEKKRKTNIRSLDLTDLSYDKKVVELINNIL